MFSGLSKLADKAFVLGFFLPALIGVVAFIALNQDVDPFTKLFQESQQDKTFANLTVMLILVWTVSVLLMAGSHWMYRVLEGYTWPLNRRSLRARQLERYKRRLSEVWDAHHAYNAAGESLNKTPTATDHADQQRRREDLARKLLRLKRLFALDFPEQGLVLPTRFGNVLRAFEMYAWDVYRVDSIHAWPRLLAVVPKDYQAMLADVRAPVDFFVSLVFTFFTLGVVALVRGIATMSGLGSVASWIYFCITGLALIAVRLSYLAALSSAKEWGEAVKSAFDLYLPALANALGYQLPKSADERQRFWEALGNQFQFHEPLLPEQWPTVARPPPAAEGSTTKSVVEPSEDAEASDDDVEVEDESVGSQEHDKTGEATKSVLPDGPSVSTHLQATNK